MRFISFIFSSRFAVVEYFGLEQFVIRSASGIAGSRPLRMEF